MYPPQPDQIRHSEFKSTIRYRSAGHNTYIGENGSLGIETIDGRILLDKPGKDGRKVSDFGSRGLTMREAPEYRAYAMDEQVQRFREILKEALPESIVEADPPNPPATNWWFYVRRQRVAVAIEYRPEIGWGIFDADPGYGEGPTHVFANPEETLNALDRIFLRSPSKKA
jgi:hypothetical protein